MKYECTCKPIIIDGSTKCRGCLLNANTYMLDMLMLLARLHQEESVRIGEQWSADPWL